MIVDDATLERGIAAGALVVDTRLRDALRALDGREAAPVLAPDDDRVVGAAVLREADIVRLLRRIDDLGARVVGIERGKHAS
jgi:hypothetical protein